MRAPAETQVLLCRLSRQVVKEADASLSRLARLACRLEQLLGSKRLAQRVVRPRLLLEADIDVLVPAVALGLLDAHASAAEYHAKPRLPAPRLRRLDLGLGNDVQRTEALAVVGWRAHQPDAIGACVVVRAPVTTAQVHRHLVGGEPIARKPAAPLRVEGGAGQFACTLEPTAQACMPPADLWQPHLDWLRLRVGLPPQRHAEAAREVVQPVHRRLEAAGGVVAAVLAHKPLHLDAQPKASDALTAVVLCTVAATPQTVETVQLELAGRKRWRPPAVQRHPACAL